MSTTFEEGAERNKALGIWGALGGSGAAAGVLFGGILTKYLGWEWIFFVNVPVGALVFALTPVFVPESRADVGHRRFDVGVARLHPPGPGSEHGEQTEHKKQAARGSGHRPGLLSLGVDYFFFSESIRSFAASAHGVPGNCCKIVSSCLRALSG